MVLRARNEAADARGNGTPQSRFARLRMIADPYQDVVFGSEGTAAADFERMEEINHEIGLTAILHGMDGDHGHSAAGEKKASLEASVEKKASHDEKSETV